MVFMRAFFRGLLLLVILISIAVWVLAATFQMTLLNRDTVKQWGEQSGAYGKLVETLEINQVDATGLVSGDMLRRAIGETFTSGYIQEQTEVIVDAAYDWVDGEASEISYTIPIHERRDEFIGNLAGVIEEKVQDLPQCGGSLSLNEECIPRAYTAETYAMSVAERTAEDSDLFEEPITSADAEPVDAVKTLPTLASLTSMAVWVLPIVVVLTGIGYVLLSKNWRLGLTNLGKRFVFSSATLVIIGALAWLFGSSVDLGTRLFGGSDATLIAMVVEPILQQAVVSVGMWLTIVAGGVVLVGIILWIIGAVLQRRSGGTPDGGEAVPASSSPTVSSSDMAQSQPTNRPPTPPKPMNF